MTTERIVNRVMPCRCGCKGRDPGHARTFDRVVRDVVPVVCWTRIADFQEPVEVDAAGWAQLPWGRHRVVRVPRRGWYVARE